MNKIIKKILWFVTVAISAIPIAASAHALPVNTTPESSATFIEMPQRVVIRFSEHIDVSASSIKVTGPSGMEVTMGEKISVSADHYTMSIPIKFDESGTYIVSWSAVSADDGHFTKGGYPFAVGKGEIVNPRIASSEEIVEVATVPEAMGMTVELLGHGFLWAILLMFAFAMRSLIVTGRFDTELDHIRHIYQSVVYIGVLFASSGGLIQIIIKSSELADLRTISFSQALHLYLATAAGSATLYRVIAMAVFAAIFIWGRKVIFVAKKLTAYETLLYLSLCFFAFERAKISHATSNLFHPAFSVFVNFFHLIEKDLWAGIVCILLLFAVSPQLRSFLDALIPRAFAMLAIDFGAVSVTASYIVWLHLKSFNNLFTTQWGTAFLELFVAAIFLVAIRFYQVLARSLKPRFFSRLLPASLAAEFALVLCVVYFSSIVIITSPPLSEQSTPILSVADQGALITVQQNNHEDGTLLLSIAGSHVSTSTDPVVTIDDEVSATGPMSVTVSKRFTGGYVFSKEFIAGTGPFKLSVTARQSHAYDAHATFELQKNTFEVPDGWESKRPLDQFSVILILVGLISVTIAFGLWVLSLQQIVSISPPHNQFIVFITLSSFLLTAFAFSAMIGVLRDSGVENSFRYECEGDGNVWHVMQPMISGVPISQIPAEGCMWGMGSAMYMFADKREYDYNNSFPHAIVTLDHAPLVAGRSATFTVELKESDGTPAKLFVDMEKLVHVVIISKDETIFAHIHPDDIQPLTKDAIKNSTFTLFYTFPKSGTYLISVDYAHRLKLESQQFIVNVSGVPSQQDRPQIYSTSGKFGGYDVALVNPTISMFGNTKAHNSLQLYSKEVSTITYNITKNEKPVTNITPYLSAAMHLSIVKNDFSDFLHVHGEVHPPGVPFPPIIVKNGQVLHSMVMMMTPPTFGPNIEAHLIFPSAGTYTVWGEFKVEGIVIPTSFTVDVK